MVCSLWILCLGPFSLMFNPSEIEGLNLGEVWPEQIFTDTMGLVLMVLIDFQINRDQKFNLAYGEQSFTCDVAKDSSLRHWVHRCTCHGWDFLKNQQHHGWLHGSDLHLIASLYLRFRSQDPGVAFKLFSWAVADSCCLHFAIVLRLTCMWCACDAVMCRWSMPNIMPESSIRKGTFFKMLGMIGMDQKRPS